MEITESLLRRFWQRVQKGEVESCWEWQGALRAGYGCMRHGEKVVNCHRLSFIIHNGLIPEGLIVGHKCDNRRCVHPHHLEAITYAQNNYDGAHRGRQRRGVKTPCGEFYEHTRLTEAVVAEARRLHRELGYKHKKIARLLGIPHPFAIREAIHYRTWKHVS